MDPAGVAALEATPNLSLAIGGGFVSATTFDTPALGMIDDVEWLNTAMCGPLLSGGSPVTPWGSLHKCSSIRKYGGWAVPLATGIELHLRRGWEGPVTSPTAYQIERREFGATGANAWQAISPTGGTRQNVMIDTTAVAGKWYEYRLPVTSKNHGHSIWGYRGTRPAMNVNSSFAIVVGVDSDLLSWEANSSGPLHTTLNTYIAAMKAAYGNNQVQLLTTMMRMKDDEDGNGFLDLVNNEALIFKEQDAKNTAYCNALTSNKSAIWAAFDSMTSQGYVTPTTTKLIVLIGHPAVPMSGSVTEDGHHFVAGVLPSHEGAWPCDAWYGDTDGQWTDAGNLASGASRWNSGPARTDWALRNVPLDGKFDQNTIPPNVAGIVALEAAVGRIDFSKMPGFVISAVDGTGQTGSRNAEIRMTSNYLNKATAYRLGSVTPANSTRVFLSKGDKMLPVLGAFIPLSTSAIGVAVTQNSGALPTSGYINLFSAPSSDVSAWGLHAGYGGYDSVQADAAYKMTAAAIKAGNIASHAAFSMLNGSFLGDWNHEPEDLTPGISMTMADANLQKAILSQPIVQNQPLTGMATAYPYTAKSVG